MVQFSDADMAFAPGAQKIALAIEDHHRVLAAIEHVEIVTAVNTDPAIAATIRAELGELADVVLSDMAPSASGHAATDHLRIVALAEAAFSATSAILIPGGTFVAKVFQGGAEGLLLAQLKRACATPSRRRAAPNRQRLTSLRRGFAVAASTHGTDEAVSRH